MTTTQHYSQEELDDLAQKLLQKTEEMVRLTEELELKIQLYDAKLAALPYSGGTAITYPQTTTPSVYPAPAPLPLSSPPFLYPTYPYNTGTVTWASNSSSPLQVQGLLNVSGTVSDIVNSYLTTLPDTKEDGDGTAGPHV